MPNGLLSMSSILPFVGNTKTHKCGRGPPQSSPGGILTNQPCQRNYTNLSHDSNGAVGTRVILLRILQRNYRYPNKTTQYKTCASRHITVVLLDMQSTLACPTAYTSLSPVCSRIVPRTGYFVHTFPQCGPSCKHTCHCCGCTHRPEDCSLLGNPCTCTKGHYT